MKGARVTYWVVYSLVFVGFLFAESARPVIGPYSLIYVGFLGAVACGFLVPAALQKLVARVGLKSVILLVASSVVSVCLLYGTAAIHYYYTREILFDPFLQAPPSLLDLPGADGQNTRRILTLGGSTTRDADEPEDTYYSTYLHPLLRETVAPDITIVNAGVPWYTTKHSTIDYTTRLYRFRPRVALVMHGINDLYRSCTPAGFSKPTYASDWSHFYGPAARAAYPWTFEQELMQRQLGLLTRKWFERPRRLLSSREVDHGLEYYRSLPDFEIHLRRLVDVLLKDGVLPVLLTQPSLYKPQMSVAEQESLSFAASFCRDREPWPYGSYPSSTSMLRALSAFNDVTRRVARDTGSLLIDVEAAIPRSLKYFTDDVHFTPDGARLLAAAIAGSLQQSAATVLR